MVVFSFSLRSAGCATGADPGIEMYRWQDKIYVLPDARRKTVIVASNMRIACTIMFPEVILGAKKAFSLSHAGVKMKPRQAMRLPDPVGGNTNRSQPSFDSIDRLFAESQSV
jgi:hypothetical protein